VCSLCAAAIVAGALCMNAIWICTSAAIGLEASVEVVRCSLILAFGDGFGNGLYHQV
jgi:hypothetical protein